MRRIRAPIAARSGAVLWSSRVVEARHQRACRLAGTAMDGRGTEAAIRCAVPRKLSRESFSSSLLQTAEPVVRSMIILGQQRGQRLFPTM